MSRQELERIKRVRPEGGGYPQGPMYHRYDVTGAPVSYRSSQHDLIKHLNRLHPAPGTLGNSVPVRDGQRGTAELFNIPGDIDDFGPIMHGVVDNGAVVINLTLEGHMLHPGYVKRIVYEKWGFIWIRTVGEGLGAYPTLMGSQASAFAMWCVKMNGFIRLKADWATLGDLADWAF